MANVVGIAQAWGDHLNSYQWDHWLTLTPRHLDCSPEKLAREFRDRFIRRLARAAGCRIHWFYAMERSFAGVFHLHVLVHGTGKMTTEAVQQLWRIGFSKVQRYCASLGACWYLSKTFDDSNCQWVTHEVSASPAPKRKDWQAVRLLVAANRDTRSTNSMAARSERNNCVHRRVKAQAT
jgi:hypothetical protein